MLKFLIRLFWSSDQWTAERDRLNESIAQKYLEIKDVEAQARIPRSMLSGHLVNEMEDAITRLVEERDYCSRKVAPFQAQKPNEQAAEAA